MKKEIWILIILTVIIVFLAGILMLPAKKNPKPNPSTGVNGIEITLPKANEEISSPLKITGIASGNGWASFEGQVGTVKLFDINGQEVAFGVLTATTEWTTLPVSFEATLNFQSDTVKTGTLVFYNENPSGLPENDKELVLPVKIPKFSSDNMVIKVYFSNNKMDPEISCNKVFAAERKILKIEAVGSAALWQLLFGPTEEEKKAGFFTSINSGVTLLGLEIKNDGTAIADFDSQLENGVGGSCKVSAIRAQIVETLKQFPTIRNVVISIDGRTEDILQP